MIVRTFPALDHFGLQRGAPEEVERVIGDFLLQ